MKPGTFLLAVGLLALPVSAQALCLRVEAKDWTVTMPLGVDDEARLAFRHSIYGSQVEEHFRVTPEGLELVRLRYAEERLVEFYGHESARSENGWWVVDGDRRRFSSLVVRGSPESRISLSVGRRSVSLSRLMEAGGVRVAPATCEGDNGR